MRRAASWLATASLIILAGAFSAAPAIAVGTSVPSAPSRVFTYPGVDGVRLYWSAPTDLGGGLNGYDVYRTGADGIAAMVGSSSASQSNFYDSTAGVGDWTYTVRAVNDAGQSPDSGAGTTTVTAPVAPGTHDALAVDGGPYTGSFAFTAPSDAVSVQPTSTAYFYAFHGVSSPSSPQGAQDVTMHIGTMSNGKRVQPGSTYLTSPTAAGSGNLVFLTPSIGCPSSMPGSLTVDEASFLSDGTPLVFSASFTYTCGGTMYGSVRWHAHTGLEAVTTSAGNADLGTVPSGVKSQPTVVTVHNAGSIAQPLGQAALAGTDAAQFGIGSDTCSNTSLTADQACTIAVTTTPAPGAWNAMLSVPAQTPHGQLTVRLAAVGVAKPVATTLYAVGGYRSVNLSWQNRAGAAETGHTVYRGLAPDQLTKLVDLPASRLTQQTFTDTTAAPETVYYYAVSDSNIAGEGPQSAPVNGMAVGRAVLFTTDAYSANGFQIALSGFPSGSMRQVTTDSGDHDTPAVSPDGTLVAYTSNHGNASSDYDLWVQNLAGGPPTRLTSGTTTADGAPAWSPDGKYLAFERFTAGVGAPSIWFVPAAGGTATQVPGTVGDIDPSWSPTGRLLAVSHIAASSQSVVVTSLDGTYRRGIPTTSGTGFGGADPSWSPDGTRIAFIHTSAAGGDVLSIAPVAGDGPLAMLPAYKDVGAVDWTPDGTHIVFERDGSPYSSTLWYYQIATGSAGLTYTESGYQHLAPSTLAPRAPYVPSATPTAPTWQGATLGSHSSTLSWAAPPGTAYVIVRRSAPNGPAPATPEDGVAVYSGTASSAVAPGLSYQTQYQIAAFAISPLGDASPAAVWSMRNAAVPGTRPNGSGSVLTSLYRGGPAFVASWTGSQLPGQVFDVQIGVRRLGRTGWTGPVWSNLVIGTRSTSKVVAASAGTTYYLRARIRDDSGNVTPWSTPTVVPVPYDDRALAATGRWSSQSRQPGRFASTVRASSSTGASLSLTTYGTSFAVVADRCAACGQMRIYVDCVYKGSVDTYSRTTRTRQVVWASRPSSLRKHRITVVVVGTPRRPAVRIDGMIASR